MLCRPLIIFMFGSPFLCSPYCSAVCLLFYYNI
nr:MAG TPA: hypothetical protein [Caudoviricetes sp.]